MPPLIFGRGIKGMTGCRPPRLGNPDVQYELKTGAAPARERPILRRLNASHAQQNDNMMTVEQLTSGPHPGSFMHNGGGGGSS